MDKKQTQDELPKWLIMASKIARHFLYGVVVLFILLKLDWTTQNINPQILGYLRIFLLIIAVPTFIFTGSDLIQILSRILNAIKNSDEHK